MYLTVFKLSNAEKHGKAKRSGFQLLIAITFKTLPWWRTDMTSTFCIHLTTHFVRMPSCFIIFMLPFSAVALAKIRFTFISAMDDHRSVLGSYRSAVLYAKSKTQPPITYNTAPSTATPWLNLERKITYFVMFYVSLVLMYICCWHRSIFLHKKQLYLRQCWIAVQISCQTNLEKLRIKAVIGICCVWTRTNSNVSEPIKLYSPIGCVNGAGHGSVCQSWTYV
jgi:hypothetical protein